MTRLVSSTSRSHRCRSRGSRLLASWTFDCCVCFLLLFLLFMSRVEDRQKMRRIKKLFTVTLTASTGTRYLAVPSLQLYQRFAITTHPFAKKLITSRENDTWPLWIIYSDTGRVAGSQKTTRVGIAINRSRTIPAVLVLGGERTPNSPS